MVNFGSPRVGNYKFAKAYDKIVPDSYRVVCDGDLVTGVPKLLFMYTHVGHEVVCDSQGNLIINPTFVEKTFRTSSRSKLRAHMMDSYRTCLDAVLAAHGIHVETGKASIKALSVQVANLPNIPLTRDANNAQSNAALNNTAQNNNANTLHANGISNSGHNRERVASHRRNESGTLQASSSHKRVGSDQSTTSTTAAATLLLQNNQQQGNVGSTGSLLGGNLYSTTGSLNNNMNNNNTYNNTQSPLLAASSAPMAVPGRRKSLEKDFRLNIDVKEDHLHTRNPIDIDKERAKELLEKVLPSSL